MMAASHPLHVFYNAPAPIGFPLPKINWNGQSARLLRFIFALIGEPGLSKRQTDSSQFPP
jgi:hypothetical protein